MAPPTWKRYRPDPTPDGEPDPRAAAKPRTRAYQPPKQPKPARTLEERTVRRRGWKLPLVGVVVLGLAGWGVVAIIRNVTAPDEPQTVEGYTAMLDDLDEELGGTTVFRAVVYPGYAVVDVPFADDERSVSYRWDGGLSESTKSTSDDVPFDLRDVDPSRFGDMCGEARTLVDDPGDCYLIVERPTSIEDAWISAYVSNDFSQGGYIAYDLDGNEVTRNQW